MKCNKAILNLALLMASLLVVTPVFAAVNIQQWTTASGTAVYFVENHDLPILDISVNFPAGSARDLKEKSGVAGITKYLMGLGAGGMTDEVIANKMADIGAVLGGSFDVDRAAFNLRTLSNVKEKNEALRIFAQILQKPDFPDTVLSREKARIISSLEESKTQPESIVNKAFMEALYGAHPYGLDESGEVDTVKSITRQDLTTFYGHYYGAKTAVIALIGDLSREEASKIAESLSQDLPASMPIAAIQAVPLPTKAIEQRYAHPASQSHILIGYPGIKRNDPDLFPLYVGNYVLGGGGFVSLLTEEVREKRGLVYSVYSYFMPMAEAGPFQIGLQTKKDQAEQAMTVVRETIDTFLKNGVTPAQLKAAKANLIGGFPMRIDSNKKILDYLAVIGFYKLPIDYLDTYNANIAKVTAAQIKEVFNRRVKPEDFVTIIVGDPKQ